MTMYKYIYLYGDTYGTIEQNIEGNRKWVTTDGQCKQRNGVSKNKEILEIKNNVTEIQNAWLVYQWTGHNKGKNLWTWRYCDENFQN